MTTQRRVIYLVGLAMTAIVAGACSMSTSDTGGTMRRRDGRARRWQRLADLPRHLQVLALQRARPDQHEQRQEPEGGLERTSTPKSKRGLQSFPLAVDGVLYYSGSYNQVYALDGATGEMIWAYKQKLNEDLVAKQTHSPYNRGIALGYGNVYMGTLDGKLVAIDMKTGKLGVGDQAGRFREAHRGLHRRAADRQGQGHHRLARRRVAVAAARSSASMPKTGKQVWQFFTVGGNDEDDRRATPGATTPGRPAAAAAGWPAATTPETNTVWWGTANPAPLYDWAGAELEDRRAASGRQPVHHVGASLLDPDTGKLKAYHQEMPHDAWDFDSAVGEFVMIERGGKKIHRAPEQGRLRVRLRPRTARCRTSGACVQEHQLRQGHRSEDRRADRPARHGRRQAQEPVPGHRRRHQLELGRRTTRRPACSTRSATNGASTSRS